MSGRGVERERWLDVCRFAESWLAVGDGYMCTCGYGRHCSPD